MIDNYEDVIDSRDVIERIAQLQALRDPGPAPEGVLNDEDYDTDQDSLFAELAQLEALAEQGSGLSDWGYGAVLVRDSYFTEHAQQLAEGTGAINPDAGWPAYCIDWERAAGDLKMDYTSVEFGDVTYWAR